MNNAQHSKKSVKWGTPLPIIEASRRALGGTIDCDPATSAAFNERVRATTFYTEESNGLAQLWNGTVFLNPPGGLVAPFWNSLCRAHLVVKSVPKAIWIGFSLEQLATLASEPVHPLDFTYLIFRKRLSFCREDSEPGTLPTHSNYLVGMGINPELFDECFSLYGKIGMGALCTDLPDDSP